MKHIGRDGKASSYALKCLRKQHIVELKQQDHIYSEKAILLSSDCPFIIKYAFRNQIWVEGGVTLNLSIKQSIVIVRLFNFGVETDFAPHLLAPPS